MTRFRQHLGHFYRSRPQAAAVLAVLALGLSLLLPQASLTAPFTTWTRTGALITARNGHNAVLLPNGQVLVVGGVGCYWRPRYPESRVELYDPARRAWSATGSMAIAGFGQTATLLPNGTVLVTGGFYQDHIAMKDFYMNNARFYYLATGAWYDTTPLATGRYGHTATLLANGQVLAAGGYGDSGRLASAELYDTANIPTWFWPATGSLTTARSGHTATLLPNGQVLVVGGDGGVGSGYLASAELYDPATGTWAVTGSLTAGRIGHKATLLPNGQVLVVGGLADYQTSLASAELYDPATGQWSTTSSLTTARSGHTATLLPKGQVLVVGGRVDFSTYLTSAEFYDPATGTWASAGSMAAARHGHTATLLTNGQVLVAGGAINVGTDTPSCSNPAELYPAPALSPGILQLLFRELTGDIQ